MTPRRREPNHEIIALARKARGLSQVQLALAIGVTNGLISKWEHGIATPPDDKIQALADALRFPSSLFFRPERVQGTDSVCFHHRKRKSMPARLLERIEAEMHLAQLQTKRLLDDLEVETPYHFLTLDPAERGGPEQVAAELRAYWRLPAGPIPNLVRVVESAGAIVLLRDFGSLKLDGMSCWAKSTPPLFFINSALPVDRQRWTIAHELGHLVMHATPPDDDQEVQAEAFARELLMPKAETMAELRRLSFQRLPSLKQIWRVPMKEVTTAASRRGAVPPNQIKSLAVQYSRAKWHSAEPYALSLEQPVLAAEAIRVHLSEHGYSPSELAEIMGLLPDEFEREYGLAPRNQLRLI